MYDLDFYFIFQASFNYPSRQPSFKQNSSEADSQPDLLQPSASGGHLGVPHPIRTSLTPPDRVYVTADTDTTEVLLSKICMEFSSLHYTLFKIAPNGKTKINKSASNQKMNTTFNKELFKIYDFEAWPKNICSL